MPQGRPPAIPLDSVGEAKLAKVFEILTDSDMAQLAKCGERTVAHHRQRIAPHTVAQKKSPGTDMHGANDQIAGNDEGTARSPVFTPA